MITTKTSVSPHKKRKEKKRKEKKRKEKKRKEKKRKIKEMCIVRRKTLGTPRGQRITTEKKIYIFRN